MNKRHEFRFIALDGMDEREIKADSIKVLCPDGSWLELSPRRSDGEVTLYASNQLVIRPQAGNCARVESRG